MSFEEAGQKYAELKEQYEHNKISFEEFKRYVEELEVVDPDGKRWRLDPMAGTWAAISPEGKAVSPVNTSRGAPESLLQFIFAFAKGMVKSLPKMIIFGLGMAVVTWMIHTYLIAKVNDGLMYYANRAALNSVVHLQETHFPGVNVFWGLFAYFFSSFLFRIRYLGPKEWFANMIRLPHNVKESVEKYGKESLAVISFGVFMALLISLIFRNFMLSWVLAFGMLLVMAAHFESMEALVLKLAVWDIQKLLKRKFVMDGQEYDCIYLILLGFAAGFVLAGIWKTKIIFTFLSALLFLALFIFLVNKGRTQKIAAFFMVLSGAVMLLEPQAVYAWCEGGSLSQVGGSWTAWWGSNNADLVRRLGLMPSGSAFLGSIAGSAAANISNLAGIEVSSMQEAAFNSEAVEADSESISEEGEEGDAPTTVLEGMGMPALQGGPSDNPATVFEGGNGPGHCFPVGLPNYWVNTAILNLVVQDTIYKWSGLGPPVDLTLIYNSGSASKIGMFGSGWSFTYDWLITQSDSRVTVSKGVGQEETYIMPQGAENKEFPIKLTPDTAGCYHSLFYYGNYWLYSAKGSPLEYRFDQVFGTGLARLTQVSDKSGNVLKIGFDAGGNIGSITDAAARMVTFQYNEAGLCEALSLPDGRTASFQYDSSGNLSRTVDLLGVTSDYQYDTQSCLTRMVVGREQKTTLFSYHGTGNVKQLASVTDARGSTTRYEMLAADPVQTRVTDPQGNAVHYYSKEGLTEAVVDPTGSCIQYTYQNGRPISFQDGNGGKTSMEYDSRGNLVRITDPCSCITVCTYDENDNLLTITNPLGETWTFTYDWQHNLVSITKPSGKKQEMRYNQRGQLTAVINTAGVESSFIYDDFGSLSRVDFPNGKSTKFTYDQYGLANLSRTDAEGNTEKYEYDANGRLTGITRPDGNTRTFGYNCCAGILTTDEKGTSRAYDRDPLLNITRYYDALGKATGYEYDPAGRLVKITDAAGRSIRIAYDNAHRPVQISDAGGNKTYLNYDKKGNLVALQEQGGQKLNFTYDPCSRMIRVTDMLNQSYAVQRDSLGRASTITNGRGETIGFSYNRDGEIVTKLYNGETAAEYQYDAAGNLAEVMDSSGGTTAYGYNSARQLESVEYSNGYKVLFHYAPTGNPASMTYPTGLKVRYEYNSRGWLSRMSWGSCFISFTYDGAGNLVEEKRSNGMGSMYSYNANYHVMAVKHGGTDDPFVDVHFSRDDVGNIVKEWGVKPLYSPWRDNACFSTKVTYNQANQLLTWDSDRFCYDEDGNLVSIQGSREFKGVYNPENMLVEVTAGGQTTNFEYNGLRQRTAAVSGGKVTRYHYSPHGQLLFESHGDGKVTRCYLYSGNRLVAVVESDGKVCFYHFDHNGSTLALTNQEAEITAAYDYSPFGFVFKGESSFYNPFTYAGAWGVFDNGNHLFFMKNRYYDALTGRFIQKDPIGISGGQNLYAYVGNNPINGIDPEGTSIVAVAVALSAMAAGAAGYTLYRRGLRFSDNNPLNRVLNAAQERDPQKIIEARGPNPQAEFFGHPEHGMGQLIDATGDKIITLNPVSGPGWSIIKGVGSAAEGKPGDVLLNMAGALPGDAGAAATAAGEILGACENP